MSPSTSSGFITVPETDGIEKGGGIMATTATIFKLYVASPRPGGEPRYGVRFGSDPLPREEDVLVVGFLEGDPDNHQELLAPGHVPPSERPSWEMAVGIARENITGKEYAEFENGLLAYDLCYSR
jgi:hypothetical protein